MKNKEPKSKQKHFHVCGVTCEPDKPECNNYCNMKTVGGVKFKGPMPDSPAEITQSSPVVETPNQVGEKAEPNLYGQLLAIRDCLIRNDKDEAYHILCTMADPDLSNENHWAAWELKSKLTPIEPLKEEWISVDERLPESNIWVLCIGATGPSFVGKYTKGHEIEYWDDDYDGPYDEVEDKAGTLYLKPGWYELEEQNHHDYDEMWMSRIVTHWMPLPSPPKV